ncbi:phosphotransferase family protein [Streptosporangium roseum]|uniref:phosphotransferase family protein n=1 Tax=Streptosporangium roseum TaxID=2001 RepID=UPI0033278FF1
MDSRCLADEIGQVFQDGYDGWRIEPLTHNTANEVTRGIWRVVKDDRSAVLKVLGRGDAGHVGWRASEDPRHWNFWRREAHVYTDGLAGSWRGSGIVAPRLLAAVERDNGEIALWTEDVRGEPGTTWTVRRHALLGHQLGLAQGRAGEIDRPWLSRSFIREYIASKNTSETAIGEVLDDDEAWSHPLVRENFPPELRGEMIRLHRDREWFLRTLESLPRVFSHLDLWPSNVLARGDESVLVDWAFAGDGAIGEDVGNHVPDSVFDLFLDAAALPELDHAVYGAYLRGLREAGWSGDERLVRLGVCASAVKYDWLVPLMLRNAGGRQLDYGGGRTVPAARRYRERGAAMMFLAGWADEARRLGGF